MSRRVLLPPMPPNPTVAMFTVSLGAWNPRPSTCRGRMVRPAPAAVVERNVRLEMSLMESPRRARILPPSAVLCPATPERGINGSMTRPQLTRLHSRRRFLHVAGAAGIAAAFGDRVLGAAPRQSRVMLPFENGGRELVAYPQKRPLIVLTA